MKNVFMLLVLSTVSVSCATNNSKDMKRSVANHEEEGLNLRFIPLFCDGIDAEFQGQDAAMDTKYCKGLKGRQLDVSKNSAGEILLKANLLIRTPSRQKGFIQTCSAVVDDSTKFDSLKDVSCVSVYDNTASYRKVLCEGIDKKMEAEHADAAIDTEDCLAISDDKTKIELTKTHRVVVSADVLIRSPGNQKGRRTSCKAYVDGVATDENVVAIECK